MTQGVGSVRNQRQNNHANDAAINQSQADGSGRYGRGLVANRNLSESRDPC